LRIKHLLLFKNVLTLKFLLVIFLLNLFNITKKNLSLYYNKITKKRSDYNLMVVQCIKTRPNVGSIISLRVHAVNSILKINSRKLVI
jgi:hypothetical protein